MEDKFKKPAVKDLIEESRRLVKASKELIEEAKRTVANSAKLLDAISETNHSLPSA